jgi:hypothetical protein
MATIVGLKNSNFNKEKFEFIFGKNTGSEITTEGIKEGYQEVKNIIDNDIIEGIKQSQYYIKAESEIK